MLDNSVFISSTRVTVSGIRSIGISEEPVYSVIRVEPIHFEDGDPVEEMANPVRVSLITKGLETLLERGLVLPVVRFANGGSIITHLGA